MKIAWLFLAWAVSAQANENILLEYKDIIITTNDLEQRYWVVPENIKISLFANREDLEQTLEGMLYDQVAVKHMNVGEIKETYRSAAYKEFLASIRQKTNVPNMVQNREGMLAWFKGKGLARGFELEEEKWLAQHWLQDQLQKAVSDEKLEKIAQEKYLIANDQQPWEDVKNHYIQKVKADVLRRKRLEIWSQLVDRSKIKTYPENFEAFLQQHAPKLAPVEGSLPQKP